MNKKSYIFTKFERMAWVKSSVIFFLMIWAGSIQAQLKSPLLYGSNYPVIATNSQDNKLYTVSIVDASELEEKFEVCVYNGNYWTCLPIFNVPGPYPSTPGTKYEITSVIEFRDEVYIGGRFINGSVFNEQSNLFKYDEDQETWTTVTNNIKTKDKGINQMVIWKDTLIAAGRFTNAGSSSVSNIARFDGSDWSFLGNNSGNEGANGEIHDLEVIDNNLFIGGDFDEVGGKSTNSVARWTNLGIWGGLGDPFNGTPTYHLDVLKNNLVAIGKKANGNPDIQVFIGGNWVFPAGLNELTCLDSDCIAQPVVINDKLYVYGPFAHGLDTIDLVLNENSKWTNTSIKLPKDIQFQPVGNYNVAYGAFNQLEEDISFNNVIGLKDNTVLLSGNVYGDENNDCNFNTSEKGILAQVVLRSTDFSNEFHLIETDKNGKWEVEVSAGKPFTIEARFPKDKFVKSCTKKTILAQSNGARVKDLNLALDFNQTNTDLSVSGSNLFGKITPSNVESAVYFYVTNAGNTIINGKSVHINFDTSLIINRSEPIPADEKPGSITWTVNNLKPGETVVFKVILDPVTKTPNTILNFTSRTGSGSIGLDSDTKDNFDTLKTNVNVYTPLVYKTVSTEGDFNIKDKIDHLDYGIYFSNPSKNVVKTVTIIDTLDTDLPLFEMRYLNESYKTLRRINGNILTVTYRDVNLAPAEFGKASTSGFFEYKFLMRSMKEKAIDQIFTNTATVIFDYATEDRTNTVTSTLQKFNSIDPIHNELGIKLYPIPCDQVLKIDNINSKTNHLKIFNSQGTLVRSVSVQAQGTQKVDLTNLSSGVYILSDGFSSVTFAVQH